MERREARAWRERGLQRWRRRGCHAWEPCGPGVAARTAGSVHVCERMGASTAISISAGARYMATGISASPRKPHMRKVTTIATTVEMHVHLMAEKSADLLPSGSSDS